MPRSSPRVRGCTRGWHTLRRRLSGNNRTDVRLRWISWASIELRLSAPRKHSQRHILQNEAANESLINTSIEEFYRSKAMYVWWMLRDMVGDAALKKRWQHTVRIRIRSPAYLQHLIEAQTHRDLEWFFDDWVYRDRGLPDFRVESVYPRAKVDGGFMVTVDDRESWQMPEPRCP